MRRPQVRRNVTEPGSGPAPTEAPPNVPARGLAGPTGAAAPTFYAVSPARTRDLSAALSAPRPGTTGINSTESPWSTVSGPEICGDADDNLARALAAHGRRPAQGVMRSGGPLADRL